MVPFPYASQSTIGGIANRKAHSVDVSPLAPDGHATGMKPLPSSRPNRSSRTTVMALPLTGPDEATLRNASLYETLVDYERLARD